jgi:hypothetical protein
MRCRAYNPTLDGALLLKIARACDQYSKNPEMRKNNVTPTYTCDVKTPYHALVIAPDGPRYARPVSL